ncbi:hypothetical protein D9758_012756 [Tetrapyrgos nigripes]|uniref:Uncharacterized protein n=1 Tax=Tetrapyrgos nigripes TaxID=182062 RepID=A0A8H5FRG8_9AGAR|nr:hypothetical protein D9758_012756 [Tetrapyrgos nigripes]
MDPSSCCLPNYSPPSSPPSFSPHIIEGERSLLYTERTSHAATGTFTMNAGNISIALTEQDEDSPLPVYSQRGVVAGSVNFEDCTNVRAVILKFQGRLRLSVTGSNASSSTIKVLSEAFLLYSGDASPESSSCPRSIPFSVIFPSTFSDGTREISLPPSYEGTFTGIPGIYAKCEYNLKVVIKTTKSLPWNKEKKIIVPLNYCPRKRPPQPIIPRLDLFSSIKTVPEEWFQTTATLKGRADSQLLPLETHFLLPSVRSFGLSDTIPFHIQITGPLSSLRVLLSHLSTERLAGLELNRPKDPYIMIMSVIIMREIYVQVNRQVVWKHCVIGKGVLRAIPPQFDSDCSNLGSSSRDDGPISGLMPDVGQSIDWEGEIRCQEDVKVGSFDAGKVSLKEFLIFSVQPGLPMQSTAFLPLRNAVPISLATDTWGSGHGGGI